MLVCLVSSYREGDLLFSCVGSVARHVDRTLVVEGPVGGGEPSSLSSTAQAEFRRIGGPVLFTTGVFASDAEKRTYALDRAKKWVEPDEPLWVLWLDGDELLIFGEYLRDWTARADLVAGEQTATGGIPLRLVQWGTGAVDLCYAKLVRGDVVRRVLESSYELELESGLVVASPNVPICGPGGVPMNWRSGLSHEEAVALLSRERSPLAGEPHLLHRPSFRDPSRGVSRLSERELLGGVEKVPKPEPVSS